jgi:acetyltransferase
MELLNRCSKETLHHRFQYGFRITPEMATRFCAIDGKREIAVVAELRTPEVDQLMGIGRLVADPSHVMAEYAVLVADEWQGKGLGSLLTDYCLELAECLGVTRVVAITTHDNNRMIEIFRKRGFRIKHDLNGRLVTVERELAPVISF